MYTLKTPVIMHTMKNSSVLTKNPVGKTLTNAKRQVIISKLYDTMLEGYHTTSEISRKTGITRLTVDRYRGLVDELIGKQKIDRNVIRNLQIRRTYQIIESLMLELEDLNKTITIENTDGTEFTRKVSSVKERTAIYSQIAKFSQHLALITGLNIETTVNVDHSKLVIIRANNSKNTETELIDNAVPTTSVIDA